MKETTVVVRNNMFEATCFTHAGTFHADEVMATAIIAELSSDKSINVDRTVDMDSVYPPANSIVYDIGFGPYDHHQKGGNGHRENGIPYAACGLIWRDFGMRLCCRVELRNEKDQRYLWEYIDKELIQGIDAYDNGVGERVNTSSISISKIVSMMNPTWDSEPSIALEDNAFLSAVNLCRAIFNYVLNNGISMARARRLVENAIDKSDGRICVFDRYVPWESHVFECDSPKAKSLLYVVYPAKRGGYQFRVVPKAAGSFEQRNEVPSEWKGLRGKDLQVITGVPDATFVHPNGFIGGADSKTGAVELATKAIEYGHCADA